MEENKFNTARGLMGAGIVFVSIGLIVGFTPFDGDPLGECGSVFNKSNQWLYGEYCDYGARTTAAILLLVLGGISLLIGFFGKQKN